MVQLSPAYAITPADSAARKAARRALLVQRFAVVSRFAHCSTPTHPRPMPPPTFRPVPRASVLAGETAEPILFPHERARVRLEVEIARDAEEWALGKACNGWLVAV